MLKKLLVLMLLFLFSSSLINSANCYTSATVKNSALIKIVNSEDALIGIPSSLELKTIRRRKRIIRKEITLNIKNNMSEKIWVKVDKGTITSLQVDVNPEFGIPIEPGHENWVNISFNDGQVNPGDNITFYATWNNNAGKAKITSSIQE